MDSKVEFAVVAHFQKLPKRAGCTGHIDSVVTANWLNGRLKLTPAQRKIQVTARAAFSRFPICGGSGRLARRKHSPGAMSRSTVAKVLNLLTQAWGVPEAPVPAASRPLLHA